VELRVSDLQMNAWTWRVYDTVKARRAAEVWRMSGTSYGAGEAAAPQISMQWGKTRPLPGDIR